MKRRTFLAHLAKTPVVGSVGGVSASRANVQAGGGSTSVPGLRAEAAATPTPIPPIDVRHAALLVMDFQPAWIETLADSDTLLARAAEAIATARDAGALVAYTRVGFTPADYAAVPDHNVIFSQLSSHPGALDEAAPAMAIDDRVAPEPDDKVVLKTRVSAFDRTDLDAWLRDLAVDTIILAGISTSGVVLSSVCDGADLDYRLVVVADGCADRDPEIQYVLIHKVFPQRAQVITVAELPDLLVSTP